MEMVVFTAIKTHKIIEICEERGIEFINVSSIDNPLYNVLDPIFVGLTVIYGKKKRRTNEREI